MFGKEAVIPLPAINTLFSPPSLLFAPPRIAEQLPATQFLWPEKMDECVAPGSIAFCWPPPNTLKFEAKNITAENMTISICDITGRILLQKNIENMSGNISAVMDINALSPGMYFVNLNTGPLQYVTKIIKE